MAKSTDKQPNNRNLNNGLWVKGQSGNPNGRPKKLLSITSLVKEELKRIPTIEEDGYDGKGKTNAYWIAHNAVRDARKGDRAARQEVWERLEGKITLPISGEDGQPIVTQIIVSSETAKKLTDEIIKGANTA